MPKVVQKRLELGDAGFVVFDLGVDLDPPARREHRGFVDRFVVAQRRQRLGHARGRECVALAHLDGRGVVRKTKAD